SHQVVGARSSMRVLGSCRQRGQGTEGCKREWEERGIAASRKSNLDFPNCDGLVSRVNGVDSGTAVGGYRYRWPSYPKLDGEVARCRVARIFEGRPGLYSGETLGTAQRHRSLIRYITRSAYRRSRRG